MKKRRLLSIVLSLCMVLALIPQMVFANDDTDELQGKLNEGGTVTLEKDYTITSTIEVNNTVNLDLNGHVIKMTTSVISVIKVNSGGNLTLQDSDSDAGHDDTSLPAGGVITGGSIAYGDGGGVCVDGGGFTMAGGTISDCYSGNGGGVCVKNNGSFEMTGGAISKCVSGATGGGGVYVNNGSFTMRDGVISGCSTGGVGGGVCVYTKGNFTMNGGTISGCYAGTDGGGVYVADSFTMNGGAITDCSVDSGGGGIALAMNSSFTMNGGTISDCRGSEGAAVAYLEATIFANGGTIMNNVELNGARIDNTTTYGGTVFYGGISIVDSGTINGKKVTFKKDDSTYAIEIVAEGNKAIEPTIKPDAPEGMVFAGWYTDEELTKPYDFESYVTEDITLYAGWEEEKITVIASFAIEVKLGSNGSPGKTVFNLQLVDRQDNKISSGDVEITGTSVTTNGKGSYKGEITFTGTESEIFNMFKENQFVFVKQEDIDDPNWEVDDTVWCLFHSDVAALSEDEEAEPSPSPIVIIPATSEKDGEDMYYYPAFPDDDEKQLDKMTFTNTYTKSVYVPTYPIGPTVPADPPGDMDTDEPGDAEDPGDTDNPGDVEEPVDVEEPADTDEPAEDTEAVADDSDETSDTSPKTGDSTDLAPWIALMILSGAGIGGTTLYTRRKRTNE